MQAKLLGLLFGLASLVALPLPADAQHRGHGGGHGWRGDIRHFHGHDLGVWRGGAWRHASYGGRLGWWWVAGGAWYYYAQPVYPYPDPYIPQVIVESAQPYAVVPNSAPVQAAPQVWYYCAPSRSYYPYVPSCAQPWQTVPATPAGAPQ